VIARSRLLRHALIERYVRRRKAMGVQIALSFYAHVNGDDPRQSMLQLIALPRLDKEVACRPTLASHRSRRSISIFRSATCSPARRLNQFRGFTDLED
jgi:hypothetical protein